MEKQSQGCKSISRDLKVPLSAVHNIIKKFITHGTVANLPGCRRKRKLNERMQRRIVQMVVKQSQSTSTQIQAVLQTEMKRYGRRPRRTPLLTQRRKKARLESQKVELFSKAHHSTVSRKRNEAYKEKNTVPTVKYGGGSKMF